MGIYEIVEVIAMMQRLIDEIYHFLLKTSIQTLLAEKEMKRKYGLHCFLFQYWKVLSSNTFTVFFYGQNLPVEGIHGDLECLQNNVSYRKSTSIRHFEQCAQ